MAKAKEMEIVKKKLSELKHPEWNVRLHPDKQIQEFKRSVEKFDQIRLIVIDENNVILAGNGLYETMLQMGYKEAWCQVKRGLSENDKKKLMLADNRIFDLGVDDMAAFDAVIAELGDDLDIPGYDDDLLKTLSADDDEVDDMMSSYGLIDDDKKAEINAAKENYKKQEENFVKEAQEYIPQKNDEANPDETGAEITQRKFITCPKCGEKIWL